VLPRLESAGDLFVSERFHHLLGFDIRKIL
jgi:hypothetical protein